MEAYEIEKMKSLLVEFPKIGCKYLKNGNTQKERKTRSLSY